MSFSQVLQHTGSHGDWWDALGHGFYKAVQCAGLTVSLYLMTATAQEGADLPRQSMLLSVREDFPQPREELDPGLLGQRCGNVAELNEGTEQCPSLWAEEMELK